MLAKIERQTCLQTYRKFPLSDEENDKYFFPNSTRSCILALRSPAKMQAKALAKSFRTFIEEMGFSSLIFLGDNNFPWRYQDNSYKPVKAALDYLVENKIGKTFNGGIEVKTVDLVYFAKHLFWLVRCNAALPVFHFMDKDQNIVGSICQYGNVHLSTLNRKSDNLIKEVVEKSGFAFFSGLCSQINTASSIPSRRTL